MAAAAVSNIVEIPLDENPQETVEIDLDDLPEESETIIEILNSEKAPLEFWLRIAKTYWSTKQPDDFVKTLEAAATAEVNISAAKKHKEAQLQVHTLLASYYMQTASEITQKERIPEQKKLFEKAAASCYSADRIDIYAESNLVRKGYLLLLDGGKWEQAMRQFNFVLASDKSNIPALLGKACVEFNLGKFAEALESYRRVLKIHPSCQASVRVSIGVCFERLGNAKQARKAFERAIALDPKNDDAMVGLAILELNSDAPNAIKRGVGLLSRAYSTNQKNVMVLNHLADHFFYKKQYQKSKQLALHAIKVCDRDDVNAESYYHLARVFHATGELDAAFQHYYQATRFESGFILPHFGLGQMYLYKKDPAKACECFELVLKAQPDSYETLKMLGSLYARMSSETKRGQARQYLKKVTKERPEDVEAWLELAAITERDNAKDALEAYNSALSITEAGHGDVLPEIWNNVGSLKVNLSDYPGAKQAYEKALLLCDQLADTPVNEEQASYYSQIRITIRYNYARLLEMTGLTEDAEAIYKDIIEKHKNYVDCYIRLGCIARGRGLTRKALGWFKEVFVYNKEHADAWTLTANVHMSKSEWQLAQKQFERLLKQPHLRKDGYSLLSLGNVYLLTARPDQRERYHSSLNRAADLYASVMKHDPRNIYAAHGIGCILAARGKFAEAKDIFIKVREATGVSRDTSNDHEGDASQYDPWLNLAHVYCEQGQYDNAIKLYENCSKKFLQGRDPKVLTYLARAYYKAEKFEDARNTLLRALHINPDDECTRLNVAISQHRFATQLLHDHSHTLATVKLAVGLLESCKEMFAYLKGIKKPKFNPKIAVKEESRCVDHIKQGHQTVERAEKREQDLLEQEQTKETERLKLQSSLALEKDEARKKAEAVEEAKRQKYQEYVAKMAEQKATIFNPIPSKKERSKKRKKEIDAFIEEDQPSADSDGSVGSDDGGKKKKSKKKAAKKTKTDKEKKKPKRKLKRADSDSDNDSASDDDEFFTAQKQEFEAKKKKVEGKTSLKSNELVFDSDSDDDDDTAALAAVDNDGDIPMEPANNDDGGADEKEADANGDGHDTNEAPKEPEGDPDASK